MIKNKLTKIILATVGVLFLSILTLFSSNKPPSIVSFVVVVAIISYLFAEMDWARYFFSKTREERVKIFEESWNNTVLRLMLLKLGIIIVAVLVVLYVVLVFRGEFHIPDFSLERSLSTLSESFSTEGPDRKIILFFLFAPWISAIIFVVFLSIRSLLNGRILLNAKTILWILGFWLALFSPIYLLTLYLGGIK